MKIRNGFVSNSSSASFLVIIETLMSDDQIHEYIRKSDEWLDKWWEGGAYETIDISNIQKGKDTPMKIAEMSPSKDKVYHRDSDETVNLDLSTTMFNDWMSVPAWKLVRALSEDKVPGMKLKKIIRTEDQMFDEYTEVEFEPMTWEYESENNSFDDGRSYKLVQNETEMDYLDYLVSATGYKPTDEEMIALAKSHLNQ